MLVRQCLRSAPVTVPPGCTMTEAAALMGAHGVGSLLVVDGGRLVGIVTDRDITVRGVAERLAADTAVEGIMSSDPVTIEGSADIFEAFVAFREAGTRRLPVVEEEDLAGIISVDDLLTSLVMEFGAVMAPIAQELVHPA